MIITERRPGGRVAWLALLLLGALARRASANEPDRAEQLFQRARALMEKDDFAAACPMLEEAYSLDHGEGTLLAMALCHEGYGKPATALREYKESLAQAVRANRPDRVMLAESHVQKLEARVPRIAVRLPSPTPADLSVTIDGAPVDRAVLVAGAPVDPGRHEIVASEPGAPPWSSGVDVATAGTLVVDVPPFAGTTPRASVSATAPPPASRSRVLPLTVGALGLAAVGVGTYFGIAAFNAEARSRDNCDGSQCSPDGVTYNHEAKTDALVADVTLGVGAVAVVTAVYLLLRGSSSPSGAARAAALGVWAGQGRAGLGLSTSW